MQEVVRLRESTAYASPYDRANLAQASAVIFAQAGMTDEALAEIEPLLAGPSWVTAHILHLDPRWDPIRDDPRFQALLETYGN